MIDDLLGLTNRFIVTVDEVNLGSWTKCDGLGVDFTPVKLLAGGDYGYEHILPGQITYPRVTLSRAMATADSAKVQSWLRKVASSYDDPGGILGYSDTQGKITLLDAHGKEVISWTLGGVHPWSWKGPSFDANTSHVAIEVLELMHTGFL
jgi:phage tail-like protein